MSQLFLSKCPVNLTGSYFCIEFKWFHKKQEV